MRLKEKGLMRIRTIKALTLSALVLCFLVSAAPAREYHVSVKGTGKNDGSSQRPFKTISAAARAAMPGDIVIVHEGVYRERVNPPRGGESDTKRIVYRAAPGEKVEIKGSEVIKNWVRVQGDVWLVSLPNASFDTFNPYSDTIHGDWFNPLGRKHHTGAVYLNGDWLNEAATRDELMNASGKAELWFATVDDKSTTIWARFAGVDPNKELVEINVRQSVFFPEKTGINYITVSGFTMRHAATNWAPPTALQVGLIGPHWSKGWIIENNVISHSKCSGVSLGKYGDQWDNTSANSAEGYLKTVERALAHGWNGRTIGHHVVRNNVISDCEQAGIVASLGAIYSTIEGNEISNIHMRRLFSGDELAAIKIHGAIDVLIRHNRVHDSWRGLWLDWMAQGTRISGNLFYGHESEDIMLEVNHGPFLIDNNLLLSRYGIHNASEGGAYVHNLLTGAIATWTDLNRQTPFHPPHGTEIAGLSNIKGGDDRWLNNVFAPAKPTEPGERYGLGLFNSREVPLLVEGNVYYGIARPYVNEKNALVLKDADPEITLVERGGSVSLTSRSWDGFGKQNAALVTSDVLGTTKVSAARFENPDGSPLTVATDYFGKPRNPANLVAGPFAHPPSGNEEVRVW
jgi:alpha-L-arabinofuranosidase